MKDKPKYPHCCKLCFNEGLFTCKMILNQDKSCMFFTTEDTNRIFLKTYYESKQKTDSSRGSGDKELHTEEQEIA